MSKAESWTINCSAFTNSAKADHFNTISKRFLEDSWDAVLKVLKGEISNENDIITYFGFKRYDNYFVKVEIGLPAYSWLEEYVSQVTQIVESTYGLYPNSPYALPVGACYLSPPLVIEGNFDEEEINEMLIEIDMYRSITLAFYPYVENKGNLLEFSQRAKRSELRKYFIKAVDLIAKLEDLNVVHGDCHGGNFVVKEDGEMVVVDFDNAGIKGRFLEMVPLNVPVHFNPVVESELKDFYTLLTLAPEMLAANSEEFADKYLAVGSFEDLLKLEELREVYGEGYWRGLRGAVEGAFDKEKPVNWLLNLLKE